MTLDEAFGRLHQLPALPNVVQEVAASFNAGEVDTDDLSRKIARDQGLTTKLLRVANSSFYGFPRRISSIHDAVVVMGLAGVRSLVLSPGLVHAFGAGTGGTLDRNQYWRRSFRVASYAKAIARLLRQPPEVAFTAGLLHDIGQLVLDICLQQEFAETLAKLPTFDNDLLAAERATLGFTHSELGAEVLRRWNFPTEIEHAVRDCHHASALLTESLTVIVHLGICIEGEEPIPDVLTRLSQEVRNQFPLDAQKLSAALPARDELEAGIADLLA